MPFAPLAYLGGGGGGGGSPEAPKHQAYRRSPDTRDRRSPVNVRAMQEFLRSKGYNIAVDGILGPQTQSAAEDWRGARNPTMWSRRIGIDDPNRSNKPANANGQRNQPNDSPNTPGRPGNKEPKGTRTPAKVRGIGSGVLSNHAINPSVYARAMVDSKYGPILGELMREENLLREASDNAITDIKNWYGNIDDNMGTRAEANKQNDARVQTAIDSIAPSFLTALGLGADDAAVGDLAATADIGSDYHSEIAASQQAFDQNLRSIAEIAGGQAQANMRRSSDQALGELRGARQDMLAARGNEYISTEQDARVLAQNMESQAMRDRMAQVQALLAAQTAPYDAAIKQQQLAGMILGNEKTQDEINEIHKGTPTGWKDPKLNRDELLTNALSTIKLPSGQWRLPMNPSWARVKSYLRTRGLNPTTPAGKQWLSDFAALSGITLGPGGNPVRRTRYTPPKR